MLNNKTRKELRMTYEEAMSENAYVTWEDVMNEFKKHGVAKLAWDFDKTENGEMELIDPYMGETIAISEGGRFSARDILSWLGY